MSCKSFLCAIRIRVKGMDYLPAHGESTACSVVMISTTGPPISGGDGCYVQMICLLDGEISSSSGRCCYQTSGLLALISIPSFPTLSMQSIPTALDYKQLSSLWSALAPAGLHTLQSAYSLDTAHYLIYTLMAKKVKSSAAPHREEYRII